MKSRHLLQLLAGLLAAGAAQAQVGTATAPADARSRAPVDLTGYWVAVVTEDWRYRMMTPDKGDFTGVPLNAAGRAVMAKWDPARDEAGGEACRAYGAAAIMRAPDAAAYHLAGWQHPEGRHGRRRADAAVPFHGHGSAGGGTELAGIFGSAVGRHATARWLRRCHRPPPDHRRRARHRRPDPGWVPAGHDDAVATGYLRKNGVPYGAGTTVEEYFDSFREPNGDVWLVVTGIVTDPEYLDQNFITSSQFRKTDASRWTPTPCQAQ